MPNLFSGSFHVRPAGPGSAPAHPAPAEHPVKERPMEAETAGAVSPAAAGQAGRRRKPPESLGIPCRSGRKPPEKIFWADPEGSAKPGIRTPRLAGVTKKLLYPMSYFRFHERKDLNLLPAFSSDEEPRSFLIFFGKSVRYTLRAEPGAPPGRRNPWFRANFPVKGPQALFTR